MIKKTGTCPSLHACCSSCASISNTCGCCWCVVDLLGAAVRQQHQARLLLHVPWQLLQDGAHKAQQGAVQLLQLLPANSGRCARARARDSHEAGWLVLAFCQRTWKLRILGAVPCAWIPQSCRNRSQLPDLKALHAPGYSMLADIHTFIKAPHAHATLLHGVQKCMHPTVAALHSQVSILAHLCSGRLVSSSSSCCDSVYSCAGSKPAGIFMHVGHASKQWQAAGRVQGVLL